MSHDFLKKRWIRVRLLLSELMNDYTKGRNFPDFKVRRWCLLTLMASARQLRWLHSSDSHPLSSGDALWRAFSYDSSCRSLFVSRAARGFGHDAAVVERPGPHAIHLATFPPRMSIGAFGRE